MKYIILVCVKKYSLDSCIPFIQNISHKNTIVVPILNVYGTGAYLQEKLSELLVTDGCIYYNKSVLLLMGSSRIRVIICSEIIKERFRFYRTSSDYLIGKIFT